jgi:hypothetical protein
VPAETSAGGVLLGRTALHRDRKLLGIPVLDTVALAGVTHQIGEAVKQFGRPAGEIRNVATEVRNVREKAEQIGKALGRRTAAPAAVSDRRSPWRHPF